MKKLSGLGRGLASLIPSKKTVKIVGAAKEDNVYNVEIHRIQANPNQPRKDIEPKALAELADSIKKYGILQPLVVSRISTDTVRGRDVAYEIIAGERRWRAAKLAGLPHVPVVVRDDFDEQRVKLEVALVENVQRRDLNVLEEAEAYGRLAGEFGLPHAEIAQKVGKSREVISNTLRILNLPGNIKEAIRSGKIERTSARALLAFKNPDQQQAMFKQLLAGNVANKNLEETAKLIHGTRKAPDYVNPRYLELQNNLSSNLGTFVAIRTNSQGGRIEIKFTNLEELNKIAKVILD